ncbi:MAG: VOC family protein [Rhodobacteraceae bacterium]|nr:VOC family protein [Paracoccaceae bacterium]
MQFHHVSLTANDANALSDFYITVFGCVDRRPAKRLSDPWVSQGNGVPGSNILSRWLTFPNTTGPFLEILEYEVMLDAAPQPPNTRGCGHIAFVVDDLNATVANVLAHGGAKQGDIVNIGSAEHPILVVYMRDPEGNIVELEQI